MTPLRVLVVDDSPINRERLSQAIQRSNIGAIVSTARDGTEALTRVQQFAPDVITLDLEMPRMDGYSFLRLLMATRPTPVIVVSSYSRKENVFRALELGALDFVAKPASGVDLELEQLLVGKLELVRAVRQSRLSALSPNVATPVQPTTSRLDRRPRVAVAIGASTGGPTALTDLLSRLEQTNEYAVLIAQHMPAKFTRTFAQRLNRYSAFNVSEGTDGESVRAGAVTVCPGNSCMEVYRDDAGDFRIRIGEPTPEERYVPNATRLLTSTAQAFGRRSIGVVLTGMGDDGAAGAQAIAAAGGQVLVETEESAVVYGMPRAARRLVPESHQAPLSAMAREIGRLVELALTAGRP
jgi:two-component system, chemotaxis family, protein-glutamate methylesterase/glutaminase